MADPVTDHLAWMRNRGLSATTVQARRLALTRAPDLLTATREDVEAHLARRRDDLAPGSFRSEVGHLRAFAAWARLFDLRVDDPTARVVTQRGTGEAVHPIPDDALTAALADADPQDRAVLALAAFAGLRAMEVAALEWRDVDLNGGVLTVRKGKGGRRRRVAVSDALAQVLTALPTRTGHVVGPWSANAVSKRASRVLGGRERGWTLHQLRHRFASAAYRGTLDIRAVQDALGHSSPATTAIYADPGREAGRAAVRAAGELVREPGAAADGGHPDG